MKNIILFIFMFLSIGIKAQSYDDSNVHYYLPVGYSVEDVGNTRHPYSTASMLYVTVIIERGNNIYCSNTGNWSFDIKRNRDKCISSINSGIRNASNIGSYNSGLSTSKYEVYSKVFLQVCGGVDTLVIMQYLRIIKNILHGTIVVVLIKENVIMR